MRCALVFVSDQVCDFGARAHLATRCGSPHTQTLTDSNYTTQTLNLAAPITDGGGFGTR